MKKRISILFAISAALLTSCAVEPLFETEGPAGTTTTVTFTPSFGLCDAGSATKAFADVPQVTNLYLAVFNEGGKSLVEYVKADPVTPATKNDTPYTYTVTLKTSEKPRVIHFIANAPEEIGFGTDVDALGSLYYNFDTESWTGQDAYWGYLKLDNGICDASNESGSAELGTALSSVKLVRNFAKITVAMAEDSNFTITRFWISNFPDCSTAAPYNREARRFETAYGTYTRVTEAMAGSRDKPGYMGFCPASSALVSLSGLDETKLSSIALEYGASAYTYEREKPLSDPLCIIVGGTSGLPGGNTETFYKIDLRDNDGSYLPILRNFTYIVTIGNVHKLGMPSVEEALNSIASGALDIDISLQGLKDLSNGKSRIAVSETERVLFDDEPFNLLYSFIPDIVDNPSYIENKTLAQWVSETPYESEDAVLAAHEPYVTIDFEPGVSGEVVQSHSVSPADEIDGYRMVSMTPVQLSDIVKKEVVTVTGHRWNGERWETIQRTVNYQLRPHLDMTLTLTPDVIPEEYTGTITATIGIEEDISKSLFTLDMMITSEQMTLSPGDDKLSISTGVGADGKPTFFMSRAITWEEYSAAASVTDGDGIRRKHFDCLLKVNTSDFENLDDSFGKGDRVLVTNTAFNTGSALLCVGENGLKRFITPHLDKEYLVAGKTAAICFGMTALPADGWINVRLNGLEPVDAETLVWVEDETDESGNPTGYSLYKMQVDKTSGESFEVRPKTGAVTAYFQFVREGEFKPSAVYEKAVTLPGFSDLKFLYNDLDYVVAGKTALACFHMEYPASGNVTIHLKNAVPEDVTLSGSDSDSDGFVEYEIPVTGNDVSFPVVISPAAGENTAYFKLTATDFSPSDVATASIQKLSFSNLKLINVNYPGKKFVIGGLPARIDFTLDDMPSDNKISINLTNLTLDDANLASVKKSGISGISKVSDGVYELTVTEKHVLLDVDVTPATGATDVSYKLTGNEFIDGGCTCTTPVGKLRFQNTRVTNTASDDVDLNYLVAGKTARIYITLEEMPLDNKISIVLTNLTLDDANLASVKKSGISDISGSDGVYELTVTARSISLDVTVATGETASSFTLSSAEFEEDFTVEKKINTRVIIDWSKVHFVDEDGETPLKNTSIYVCDEDYNDLLNIHINDVGNILDEDDNPIEKTTLDLPYTYSILFYDEGVLESDLWSLSDFVDALQSDSGVTIVMKE